MHRLLPALAVVALIAAYGAWSQQRPAGHYLSDLRGELAGEPGGAVAGIDLLAIEPVLNPHDYQHVDRLRLKLASHLQQARAAGLLGPRTLVVFPEHIGSGLLLLGEKRELYQARSRRQALRWLAASNPLDLALGLLRAKGRPRSLAALLQMKAQDMADAYQQLFAGLAREFGVTLVAGSIVLPQPELRDGRLRAGNGPLYNLSLVFGADGRPLGTPHYKQHAEAFEAGLLSDAPAPPPQVVVTPLGRLGVLLGADADDSRLRAALQAQQVELLAMPRFVAAGASRVEHGIAATWRGRLWDFPEDGERAHGPARLYHHALD